MFQQEVRNCMQGQKKQDRAGRLENIKKEVICHKEMYKLAKEKKAARIFIVHEILDDGFNASVQGYLSSESSYNQQYVDQFKKECEIFAIAGEQLSKVLPIKTLQEWKERKNNFDNWMKEVKQVIRDQQQMEQINLP